MKIRETLPALLVVTALLWGCDATTRYNTLRFFFDGVPDPEEEKAARIVKTANVDTTGRKATRSVGGHGPYAAKQCDACHMRQNNALVAPIDELCFRCHDIRPDKRWVHGPLASGGCRACHEPHSSAYPFLLVSDSESFCFTCHDEMAVAAGQAHKGNAMKCTTCHDAHASDKKFLLK